MKSFIITALLLIVLSSISLTGFQCGSAEITSAKLYLQRGDLENAERALVTETTKNPANAEAWFLLGQTRARRDNYAGMLEPFDKCLAISKEYEKQIQDEKKSAWGKTLNSGVNNFNTCGTLMKSDSPTAKDSANIFRTKAIEDYQLAIKILPDSEITYEYLAIAQLVGQQYDDEIASLNQALEHRPSSKLYSMLVNAYLSKAEIADSKKDSVAAKASYNDALAALDKARKFEPDNPELLDKMITIYINQGRADDAKPLIREAVEKDPTNEVYQYDLGVLLMQTDSVEAAIPHFEAALQKKPDYDVALQNLAVAYLKIGDSMKKAAQAEGVKGTNQAYIEKFKKAAEYFERLCQVKPDVAAYWDYLASAYANANMVKEAKDAIKKADDLRKK